MAVGMLQSEGLEDGISIFRHSYSRARFCVGVGRWQLTCFLASIIVWLFSCSKKFVKQLCWNDSEFTHEHSLGERRHWLIEFGSSIKIG